MEIEIIRSKRKTVSVEIKKDLRVLVRAPLRMSDKRIEAFIGEKRSWIEKNYLAMKEKAQTRRLPKLSSEELSDIKIRAKSELPERVEMLSKLVGVTYNRVSIKALKSRWGSCSQKKNINLNCLLVLCPKPVTEYVIIHELCHLKELNHSQRFWSEVEKYCPDYKRHKEWLKNHERETIERLP